MTIASSIFDWLADFFRDRRHDLTRGEMLKAFHALGVMHANLLEAKPDLAEFAKLWRAHDRLDSHVTFAPYWGAPSAYERRQRDAIAPEVMESRAAVAAKLLGRANVDAWHAMLDKAPPHKGMLNGAKYEHRRSRRSKAVPQVSGD